MQRGVLILCSAIAVRAARADEVRLSDPRKVAFQLDASHWPFALRPQPPAAGERPIELLVGDHVVVAPPPRITTRFLHRCHKDGSKFLFWGEPAEDRTVPVEISWRPPVGFRFAGTELAFDTTAMHFVAPADGVLSPGASTYQSSDYVTARTRNPCPAGFKHRGLQGEPPLPPQVTVTVTVCRSGVAGSHGAECDAP